MRRFKNILVVCDDRSAYAHAMDRVRWLAKANDADVTLIDVIDGAPGDLGRLFGALPGARGEELEDQILEAHRTRIEQIAAPLRAEGLRVRTTVRQGTAFIEIIRRVLREEHDLVLKGADLSPDRPLFRGPDLHLMRKCPCPVWVLNSRNGPRASRILACIDPEATTPARATLNARIMELATSLAAQDDARIDVLSVWNVQEEGTLRHSMVKIPDSEIAMILLREETETRARLDDMVERFEGFADRMRPLHVKGVAADVITQHVADEGIDTVVMGTVARTGIAGFFIGNTAETVLNRVSCSVLTVKPRGFVSPVTMAGDGTEEDA